MKPYPFNSMNGDLVCDGKELSFRSVSPSFSLLVKSDAELKKEMLELIKIKEAQDLEVKKCRTFSHLYANEPEGRESRLLDKMLNNMLRKFEKKLERGEPEKKVKTKTWSKLFEKSPEWKALRNKFFAASNKICARCGAIDQLQVDHIKPKYKYRDLALEETNLQILCWTCNRKKSAREE